ncbi:pyrroline-5-carboxylate reductase family protein [Sphingobium boeckii]|uniref:Pyrroline-5-carboxylate reductase n=1 Tax=Sphingobium boeckii TaxID=1082345 RepID=A0A7W9AED9_9SPHN|nr:pyrroline-5-carboxylate reductase [Sphingobium boeckii]MBB5684157.1 pyrroline-5-carboxylate reductase [Sphingobium boeckii]
MTHYPFSPTHPLWLLGCGNMAGAMLARWLETGLDPAAVTVIDPSRTEAPAGVRLLAAPPQGEAPPAALLLGVKPQIFAAASAGLSIKGSAIISIMAGVDGASLAARLPDASAIVRLMPNLPAALGKGVALLHASKGDAKAMADALATPLGLALWVESEALIDAGTAVSGSGPAFVYRFIDAMAAGAEKLGFTADQAQALALATVEGAAALASASPESPAILADRVASPKGTTRAGLDVLDEDAAIYTLIHRTLKAAADRAGALAEEARNG